METTAYRPSTSPHVSQSVSHIHRVPPVLSIYPRTSPCGPKKDIKEAAIVLSKFPEKTTKGHTPTKSYEQNRHELSLRTSLQGSTNWGLPLGPNGTNLAKGVLVGQVPSVSPWLYVRLGLIGPEQHWKAASLKSAKFWSGFLPDVPLKVWGLSPCSRHEKRTQTLTFESRILSGGVGVFHMKGWGPKSSVCVSKPGTSNLFGGMSRDFAGISRRCPKSLRKKRLCSIFGPYCLCNPLQISQSKSS